MDYTPFENKNIVLGVTGSIAAYKAADLASKLSQLRARVEVILTESATQFVSPLTFHSVTGRRSYVDADMWNNVSHVQHIQLGKEADLMVIAPASANTMARLAHGLADNLLTVTALAARCPLLIAPAMDGGMFTHPATQANVELLASRGVTIVGPASGHLASRLEGVGRMVEPAELLGYIRLLLSRGGPLTGKRVLVTAGGTEEPIDPVRSITNRSSGKQGFALAQAALDMGAEVTLIAGLTHLETPVGLERINVRTAAEMQAAVLEAIPDQDVLIMAAAVADFRPASAAAQKIKREGGGLTEIRLEQNPDILASVAEYKAAKGYPKVTVGFAAESQDLFENAKKKLASKRLDLIVANDISASDAGFSVDTNRVILLSPNMRVDELPLLSKSEVSRTILQRVTRLLDNP